MDLLKKKTILFVLLQILLLSLTILYMLLKRNSAPGFLFWILMLVNITLVCYLIFYYRQNSIIFLGLFAITIGIIPIAYLNEVFYLEKDAIFESQLSNLIIRNTKLDPTLGKGFAENYYGYNPLLHVTLANLSLISGLDPFTLSKYLLPLIFRIILLILVFLITRELTSDNLIAGITSLLVIISPAFIPISVSRRTMAQIFLLVSLLFMIRYTKKSKLEYEVLFLISSIFIIISDHTTSYLFLLILLSSLLFSFILKIFLVKYNANIFKGLLLNFVIFLFLFILWEVLYANVLFTTEAGYISDIIDFIKRDVDISSIAGTPVFGPSAVHINYAYETFLSYFSQFIFLGLSFIGLIYFVFRYYNKFNFHERKILLFLIMFSFTGYFFAGILLRTRLGVFSTTILWFFTIPLSIALAFLVKYLINSPKKFYNISICIIFLIMFLGSLLIGFTPSIVNRNFDEDIVLGEPRSRNLEIFKSGAWLQKQTPKGFIVGDPTIFDVYSGFYEFDVSTDFETKNIYLSSSDELGDILSDRLSFGNYKHTITKNKIDYLIINRGVFQYPSFLFNEALDVEYNYKFENSKALNKIYQNNIVSIYENRLR